MIDKNFELEKKECTDGQNNQSLALITISRPIMGMDRPFGMVQFRYRHKNLRQLSEKVFLVSLLFMVIKFVYTN